MTIKLVNFFIVCLLINKSFQLDFNENYCLKNDRKNDKLNNRHKLIENSIFQLDLLPDENDKNFDVVIGLRPKSLLHEFSIKKILIQAFLIQNSQTIGTWEVPIQSQFQIIDCEKEKVKRLLNLFKLNFQILLFRIP